MAIGKVKVVRPKGTRRTRIEKGITDSLVENANFMRSWIIDNGKVATGTAAGNLRVVITHQADPGRRLRAIRKTARRLGQQQFSDDLSKANTVLNLASIGMVSGQIQGVRYIDYVLNGRGPGQMPPVDVIRTWMIAKGVEPLYSLRQSTYLIARKIGAQGTNDPRFTEKLQTQITRASTSKMIRSIRKPLAKVIGKRFVRFLIAAGNDYDNMELSSDTVTKFNQALDDL